MSRKPCFDNILKVLKRQTPDRPTLFEFFLNKGLYEYLTNEAFTSGDFTSQYDIVIKAFMAAGYDYASLKGSEFAFPAKSHDKQKTISVNDGAVITSRAEFERYGWPDPASFDYSRLDRCREALPDGMKIIVWGPGGVLENVTELVGYDNLCYMLAEDPELVSDICDAVGSRLIQYYEICSEFDTVGALISNDDWGFQTQTLISPADLRRYIFPYHKRIVEVIHASGKPAILHSCGNLTEVWDDIIDGMKYDGKHSYEDNILPVEDAYIRYHDRIAILGGIGLDFMCRSTPKEIVDRCQNMIELTDGCSGYALGTGNSVPEYVPYENYFAMIGTVRGNE
ncbi:MAG: uroporphyrinogen decarboxylase family protein [Saccharofermentanales bacterium]